MIKSDNIFIAGASYGLGAEIAKQYSGEGCRLFLCARSEDKLKQLCQSINKNEIIADYSICDIRNRQQVRETIDKAKTFLGNIDTAYLISGVSGTNYFGKFDYESFKNVIDTNVIGLVHCLEFLIPVMKEQGFGKIAGIGSLADARGFTGSAPYCSSKIAVKYILEAARTELKNDNINIITIRPGFINTTFVRKNNFYMPMLLNPENAIKHIIKKVEEGKPRISFPIPIAILNRIARSVPDFIFERIMRFGDKYLRQR